MADKDISEIMCSLGKIWDAINDLRVLIASSYVTKDDQGKCKEEHQRNMNELKSITKGQVPGWLLIVLPILSGLLVGLAVALFK